MAISLRASEPGLKLVDQARRKKGWTKTDEALCRVAETSSATLKRFWRRLPIKQETFVAISQALDVENWEELVAESEIHEEEPTSQTLRSEVAGESNLILGQTLRMRYKILERLPDGELSETYLAEDGDLGNSRCVVKKLMSRSKEDTRQLFQASLETLYQLSNHDQIPRLLAFFEEGEDFYLVKEYIAGHDLSQELIEGEQWKESEVIELLQDILEVLSFVHQRQVIHRNIHPKNLIRRKSDRKIVMIDFEEFKTIRAGHNTRTFSYPNAEGYVPPEQAAGLPRLCSDIYTVGMIGIQALTGVHPGKLKIQADTGEIIWADLVKVNEKLTEVLNKMVCYDFRRRYQSAKEALQALKGLDSAPK
ncbi:serine/threonine-protein kinase [Microcoleus sp. Pol11C3]|uniref:serine/threonine-protein kinase n=1 Tax=Microcoleus sp. Pol11C3 TaxID=3055390 RepID=UPI002FD0F108